MAIEALYYHSVQSTASSRCGVRLFIESYRGGRMSVLLQTIVPAIAGLVGAAIGSGSVLLSGYLQSNREKYRQNTERLLSKAETLGSQMLHMNTLIQDYVHDIGRQELTKESKDGYSSKIMAAYYNISMIADLYFPRVILDPSKREQHMQNYLEVYLLELFRNQNSDAGIRGGDGSEARQVEFRLNDEGMKVSNRLDAFFNEILALVHKRMGIYDFRHNAARA